MFRSLYVRVVAYYFTAVLISVTIGLAAAVYWLQPDSDEQAEARLADKAQQIVSLYDTTQPADRDGYVERAAQLSDLRIELTRAGDTGGQPQRYNWPTEDGVCDCERSVSLQWDAGDTVYEMTVREHAGDDTGLKLVVITLSIVIAVGSLLMLPLARRLVQPIKAVTSAAAQIATGRFDVLLPKHRRDETGDLSQAIEHMAMALGQLDQERQTFVANVSHEFQSPLTSIRGFSAMLLEGGLEPSEQQRALHIINQESGRLSRLSDHLLRLASLESNRQPLRLSPFDLAEQIRRTILAFEPQWTKKRQSVEMDADRRTVVTADEALLEQVWVNLMSNAVKFAPVEGNIHIRIEPGDDDVTVCFTNSGPAIPMEERTRIWDRFYKLDRARSRQAEGSGLGLSIVRKITELHNGEASVYANEDQGAGENNTFAIRLPVRPKR